MEVKENGYRDTEDELRKVYEELYSEIAQRKEVEEESQKRNRQQEAILNNIPDTCYILFNNYEFGLM